MEASNGREIACQFATYFQILLYTIGIDHPMQRQYLREFQHFHRRMLANNQHQNDEAMTSYLCHGNGSKMS